MELSTLTAISPIDGRYRKQTQELEYYFSEYALMKYRLRVEIEYLIELSKLGFPALKKISENDVTYMRIIADDFGLLDAERIKQIEAVTNHDIKALEYFIKEKLSLRLDPKVLEFVHFGLTSQDVNNTAVPLSMKNAMHDVYIPEIANIVKTLKRLARKWKDIPMLARTHGQPASPTRLGKEILVFAERIEKQLKLLKTIPYSAKFGGATGNFNAHHAAFPETDWVAFGNYFVNNVLGLNRSQTTTQIDHYDNMAAIFHNLERINTILIDFARDMWTYISMEYFTQIIKANEVGSSAMPHKVNPIDFENAEGNLGVANAVFNHLAAKLPISRLQRDLTDSTVLRNIGVPMAHTLIAFKSIQKGISKVNVNKKAIFTDLDNNRVVLAEAIQTILRREGYPKPYEALKQLTRTGKSLSTNDLNNFINSLEVSDEVKQEMLRLTPHNYTGI